MNQGEKVTISSTEAVRLGIVVGWLVGCSANVREINIKEAKRILYGNAEISHNT